MTFSQEMENKHGQMEACIKVCTKMGKNMDLENMNGLMVVFMKEAGLTIKSKVGASISGQMDECMMAIG